MAGNTLVLAKRLWALADLGMKRPTELWHVGGNRGALGKLSSLSKHWLGSESGAFSPAQKMPASYCIQLVLQLRASKSC